MEKYKLINFNTIKDSRGNLTYIENKHLPFKINRSYWLFDIHSNKIRDGHSYKNLKEILICLNGSVKVNLLNENGEFKSIILDDPNVGLYLPSNYWRSFECKNMNNLILFLCSDFYNKNDLIDNLNDFSYEYKI